MPVIYKLDKLFKVGTLYRAEADKAYIVRKAGTTSTTLAKAIVAGSPVIELIQESAPAFPINTNLIPPWELGD